MKRIRLELAASAAKRIADGCAPAVSRDDVTPVLAGVFVKIEAGEVSAWATDRYRAHCVTAPVMSQRAGKHLGAIVPRHVWVWLGKVAGRLYPGGPFARRVVFEFEQREDGDPVASGSVRVTVCADGGESVQIHAPLIAGNFPPIWGLFKVAEAAGPAERVLPIGARFLVDVSRIAGRHGAVTVRHTAAPGGKLTGPTVVTCGDRFTALIQPIYKPKEED